MPVATTDDGVSISWEAQGHGPPIMLLHGVTQDRLLWKPIAVCQPVGEGCGEIVIVARAEDSM